MNTKFSNIANLPTTYGDFKICSFKDENSSHEHAVIFKGEIEHQEAILVRVHSECLTGDVFTSRKCDCYEQLHKSLEIISKEGRGAIIYLRQEGRGIGLFNKVNAYALQDEGQDTIQANHSLGFETDLRDFSIAGDVLEHLQVKSIVMLTNNPEKISTLEKFGINVVDIMPVRIEPNEFNERYLTTKKDELKHLL